jgi:hypothetical protein
MGWIVFGQSEQIGRIGVESVSYLLYRLQRNIHLPSSDI